MESDFRSLLDRTTNLPNKLLELFSLSPATFSSSSSCCQFVESPEKLHRKMERIRAALQDAEEREIWESGVRLWLGELRDVSYAAEDVLDKVEYELLWFQMACYAEEHAPAAHGEGGTKRKREASGSCAAPALSPPLHDPSFQHQIVAQIKKIDGLFDEICEDGLPLRLHDLGGQGRTASPLEPPPLRVPPVGCLPDERGARGREGDKWKVIDLLVSDVGDGDYGMRGIGNIDSRSTCLQ